MSTKEESSYFAFISYKSEDSEWAIWLQHELTHYHLPASYNGRKNVRKNLRPVFRDLDELSAGNLREQIHKALKNSQNLIVICSPKSAKSKWVNDEIETFISLGRTDRIFPFIVDGSKPESFFPPALLALPKDKERLGGDVRLSGKDAAFVKVVAGMLGLRFSSLWNKYEIEKAEEQRKVREQRDNLYRIQSRFLAESAGSETASENSFLARRLAFTALPAPGDIDGRPYVAEAEKALRESFLSDSFKISVPLQSPERAKLVTTRGRREVLLFSPEELYVVDPATGKVLLYLVRPQRRYFDYEMDQFRSNSFFENGAVSPDGKLLATVHGDKTCRIWNMETGELLANIEAVFDYEEFEKVFPDFDPYDEDNRDSIGMDTVPQPIACVRFSPDGGTLAVSSYNCTLWDTHSFQKVKSLYSPEPFAGDIDISPDGRHITSSRGFWSIESGEWTDYNLPCQDGDSPLCQFSQDGKRVGIVSAPHIFVLDFESRSILHEAQARPHSLNDASFSPDLEYLYYKEQDKILRLNPSSKEEQEILSGDNHCFCIDAPSRGILVYTAESILSYRSAASAVEELALSLPEDDGHLQIAAMRYPFIAYTYCVSSDDGSSVNLDDMTEIAVYDISTGKVRCFLEGLKYRTDKVAFSSDLEYLTAIDNEFLVWKIPAANDSGEPPVVQPCNRFPLADDHITSMLPLNGGKGIIYAASFVLGLNDGKNTVLIETPAENDSKFPSGWHKGAEGTTHYWKEEAWDEHESYYATALAMSPEGAHLLAAYNDFYLRVWDVKTRKLLKRIYLNGEEASTIEYSPDGQYALVSLVSGAVAVFNAQDNYLEVLTATVTHDSRYSKSLLLPLLSSFDWASERILFLYPYYDDENHRTSASGALAFPPLEGLLDRVKKQFGEVTFSDEEKKKYLLD